jgi:hypothetical protein
MVLAFLAMAVDTPEAVVTLLVTSPTPLPQKKSNFLEPAVEGALLEATAPGMDTQSYAWLVAAKPALEYVQHTPLMALTFPVTIPTISMPRNILSKMGLLRSYLALNSPETAKSEGDVAAQQILQ